MAIVISIAVLLCVVQAYVDFRWLGSAGEIAELKGQNGQMAAQLSGLQGTVDAMNNVLKHYDAAIGPKGTVRQVAEQLASGDMDLQVKSLSVVANGKALVFMGTKPDSGGVVTVASLDGSSGAELGAGPGKTWVALKGATGSEGAHVSHSATLASDGLSLLKGFDAAAPTDTASLSIGDSGADLSLAQGGGGNVSVDTSTIGARAKVSIWEDGSPKRSLSLSTGEGDADPFVSLSGSQSAYTMTLVPDRLSLINKSGSVTLTAAGDEFGGFFVANDKGGERRAVLASGTDGRGNLGVFGADGRSNTLLPEFNIQKGGTIQK
jgi:hypothetical protein